jgi:pyrroline-5-carboxylate reductase
MQQQTVVIVGAGGKMGARAVEKIGKESRFRVLLCESDALRARELEKEGFQVIATESALPEADFVVMAVPDALIGRIAGQLVPHMKEGATLIMLDACAAYLNQLPRRPTLTFMITHPCHPPFFFFEQSTPQARHDYFGGVALQDILVSLVTGSEVRFQEGSEVCKAMFGPVRNAYRVSPEQFALLEPAMSEIVVATAACLMKASLDAAVEKGVPEEAARAFMAGHARIAMAITFGAEKSPFSDAAKIAIEFGMKEVIRSDWKKVFEPKVLREAIEVMLGVDAVEPAK